jgi:hypothetical protein
MESGKRKDENGKLKAEMESGKRKDESGTLKAENSRSCLKEARLTGDEDGCKPPWKDES